MNQQQLSDHIFQQLDQEKEQLRQYWNQSGPVRHFVLDNLLPTEWATELFTALPDASKLMVRDTAKERKRIGIALEEYDPRMRAILFSFQDDRIVKLVSEITGAEDLSADESLYGSGISMMMKDDFLMPHLDNSHDGDGQLYRVLNALYYISPGWPEDKGGNLELWDKTMHERKEVHAAFNRLIMMETHTASIHSVSKVLKDGVRACISNYYFSPEPIQHKKYIHKTTFYARPEDGLIKKFRFQAEGTAKKFLSGIFDNKSSGSKHRRK